MTSPAASLCGGCKWWFAPAVQSEPGQCRRYPPSGAPQVAASAWPYVFPDDWCGEFSAVTAPDFVATYTWIGNPPPPGAGEMRSDSRNWTNASQLSFTAADNTGTDQTPAFTTMVVNDRVRAEQASNTANWRTWVLTAAPVHNADLTWTLQVTSTGTGGVDPANATATTLTFRAID